MIQHSYYYDLINEIFHELDRFSSFRIYYRTVVRTDDSGDSFVLESVNRKSDPEMFGRALETLITEVRARIMTELKFLSDRESTLFLEEVLEKYLEFKHMVLEPGKTPTITVKSWGIDNDLYLFCPHRVCRGDTHEVPGKVPFSVLSQAADFARTWFEQMNEAADRARAILAASWFRYNEGNTSKGKADAGETGKEQRGDPESKAGSMETKPPANGKIILNCSVARVGLHLRLLKDEGLFVDTSAVDVCKILSKVIRTVNQEDISYRSLKNAMDAPKEQAIRLFMEKWADYLDRAENDMYLN
jgi:hypothetical protein